MSHAIKEKNWTEFFWSARCEEFAKIINSLESNEVHDYGCGNAALKRYLKNKKYIGYDLYRAPHIDVVVDLNEGIPKLKGPPKYRIASCQGVLEAITDLPKFFKELYVNFNYVIFSYISAERSQWTRIYGLENCPLLTFTKLEKIVAENFGGNIPREVKSIYSEDLQHIEQKIYIVSNPLL
jgi:hypothetical protein